MKLLNYYDNGLRMGVVTDKGVVDVELALRANPTSLQVPTTVREVLNGGPQAQDALSHYIANLPPTDNANYLKQEDRLTLAPCVADPGKIICIGLNYRRHAEETNMPIPAFPILFNKFENTLNGHGHTVPLPSNSSKVDYEAELTVVIGKNAKNVSEADALDYVFGYCNANDLSARDLQFRTSQWLTGKSCDGFSPIGPYLVTADEVRDPNALDIRCIVNGEIRQNSNTADMIFDVKQIVSYVSQVMTLKPGDLIMTGTPEGVVMGYPEEKQIYLKPGDVVTIEIEKLGSITNTMVSEEAGA
ncbi:fumarylacetoacetate hydrolase family protein [Cohnella thailandensis]|uniref:Fumarylacetoacetate hydrolase family protein n=1 Tax=Cohnella thailandensis TaxID=557557 RepID=A0A841SVN8_9BACL|nr:fumarylacetoacetate hydrolase family protein [Cohnella thailandensis]MBB6635984.1 fumarylacetoacetate hydrolase family protein [Cohnella thailandensis]MBP1976362.1 2-keto-4-pentenoate hydratase/2-oxohepta-3-ene-1,7-dioic acid hydratase in catechol pathway [Cohnella thailandensis]